MLGDGDDDGDISGCPSYKKLIRWIDSIIYQRIV